ncbi:MAG TPA: hypothetical protein VGC73_08315, partial [Pyrinomonadaceae bacterium]
MDAVSLRLLCRFASNATLQLETAKPLQNSDFRGKSLSTAMPAIPFDSLQTFSSDSGPVGQFFSLPELEKNGVGPVSRLPHSV